MAFYELYDGAWAMDDGGVRMFLLTGSEAALLIDTGMTNPDVLGEARKVTTLPITLINTHADPDHISANGQFEEFYMHPSEFIVYYNLQKRTGKALPVFDGDEFDLGGRTVEVLHVPGHTPGSITIFDWQNRCLIGGDPVQEDGNIFMFGLHRNMEAYRIGLEHLLEREEEFDCIYPSHAKLCVKKDVIPALIRGAQDVMDGKIQGQPGEMHGTPITVYDIGVDRFLCEAGKC